MKWDSLNRDKSNQGNESFECYTYDFTHDYISINVIIKTNLKLILKRYFLTMIKYNLM